MEKRAAIDSLLQVLASARERPHMYFDPIEPSQLIPWLQGLRTGMSICGVDWPTDLRGKALQRRGIELRPKWEDDILAARGMSSKEIVLELLLIESEMWQSQRQAYA